jgi:hypothetical protein|tara:strand:- start:3176 stop:3346 length:171 start_codon:yes stop_codon:yes gene_type:complete
MKNKEHFFKQHPELKDNIRWAVINLEKRQTPWDEAARLKNQSQNKHHYKVNRCRHI